MKQLISVQRGIDFIEANLDHEVSLQAVAQAADMSQWYYQRVFKALSHETLKGYIRGRRLSRAAEELLQSNRRIIDIALAAGYESQESFSRAFKAQFLSSPDLFRRQGDARQFVAKVVIDGEYLLHMNGNIGLTPELVEWPARRLVGLQTAYFGVESHKNNFSKTIPPLWTEFLRRVDELGTGFSEALGVVQIPPDGEETLHYLACIEAEGNLPLPSGFQALDLSAGRYAVFEHRGDAKLLDHTVNYIYSHWLLNSDYHHTGAPDIELYGARYSPESDDSVVHYAVPVSL